MDPLGPITIEQSKTDAAVRGILGILGGGAMILVAIAGTLGMFSPGREAMGFRAIYAGVLGIGAIAYGRSQLMLSRQDMRTHFHADLEGMHGLVFPTPDLVPWSDVDSIQGWISDLDIKLTNGQTIHIKESLVGNAKGLKGLPSSKKIAERLESLRAYAQDSEKIHLPENRG